MIGKKSGFFKGFTPTKNASKEPLLAYTKAENHFSLQEMQTKEGFLGILADDVIMLDADTEEASEALLKIISLDIGMVAMANQRVITSLFRKRIP